MEMVSRDMKSLGTFGSASISFGVDPKSHKAVEYREPVHHLTPATRKIYTAPRWLAKSQDQITVR